MDKRIVYSAVAVPDKPDHDGDVLTREQIEEMMLVFMEKYRNIDIQHTLNNVGTVVECYTTKEKYTVETPQGKKEYPKGTWIIGIKVLHDETWQKIKSGELTGVSLMAVKKTVFNEVAAKSTHGLSHGLSEDDLIAIKSKTTLKDLGDDLEVVFVSIVDEPAVPDATFFAVKSKKSFMDKLKEKVIKTAKDDSGITRKEVSSLNDEEVKKLLEAISDLQEKVSKLEGEQDAEENNDTSENPEESPEETEEVEKEDSTTDSGETASESETSEEETDTSEKEEEEENKEDLEAQVADLQKQIEDLKGKGSAKKEKSRKAKGSDFDSKEDEEENVYKSKFPRDATGRRIYE